MAKRKHPRRPRPRACQSLQWHGSWALVDRVLGYVYTVSVTDPGKYRDAKSVLAVLVDSGMVEHDLHADRYRLLPGMLRRARAVLAVAFA